jgi:hypothetical protein
MNYIHPGSVHIQGASGHPLITLLPSTIGAIRSFQQTYPGVNMTTLINETINNALEEKEQSIRSLEIVGEQL